jgi:predicted RNA-binding Zn ribbon-like protein
MDEVHSEAEALRLIGGVLCLDFANTLNGHSRAVGHEYLKDYRDLVIWCRKAGVLSLGQAERLLQEKVSQPEKEAKAYRRLIRLRETIYRIFAAIAHSQSPESPDLADLNDARMDALAHSSIVQTRLGFVLDWVEPLALKRIAWPLVLSAADLLTSGEASQVRQCAGEGCDWLFLDTSRNHLRRWCSMDECGNRAKSRRFAQRKRNQQA